MWERVANRVSGGRQIEPHQNHRGGTAGPDPRSAGLRASAAFVAILLFSGLAPLAQADYWQAGADSAHSNFVRAGLPDDLDVAFYLTQDVPVSSGTPVIVNDAIYFLSVASRVEEDQPFFADVTVYRMSLSGGPLHPVVNFESTQGSTNFELATNGALLFLYNSDQVIAFDLQGREKWRSYVAPPGYSCQPPRFQSDSWFILCSHNDVQFPGTYRIWKLDYVGRELWSTSYQTDGLTGSTDGVADYVIAGNTAITAIRRPTTATGIEVWFQTIGGDGATVWTPSVDTTSPPNQIVREAGKVNEQSASLSANEEAVFVRSAGWLYALRLADTVELWSAPIGEFGDQAAIPGAVGDFVVVQYPGGTQAYDRGAGTPVWTTPFPSSTDPARNQRPLIFGDQVVGEVRNGLAAVLDINDGRLAHRLTVLDQSGSPAPTGTAFWTVGSGVLVGTVANSGSITVFGHTPASIQIAADVPQRPPTDKPVRLDFSASDTGLLGFELRGTIDWGDGESTPLETDLLANHTYTEVGQRTITVKLYNEAGQQATRRWIVDVGAVVPPPPTFLEDRFSQENQESSFFILGLLITSAFAVLGALRLARRRARLRRELRSVDAAAKAAVGNPIELHRAMIGCSDRAKALVLAGRLDEGQYALVERYISKLGAGGRLESIEQDFPFLPMSLGATLQRMLDDGRISKWERKTFLAALEIDDVLSPKQKAKVASRIEDWFAEDA